MGPISCPRLCYLGLLVASLFFRWGVCYQGIYESECNGATNCFKKCPREWVFYSDSCYGFLSENVPWAEAEIRCFQYNEGHLASILNREEMEVVANLITSKNEDSGDVWIGLHDPRENRRWRWTDQSISSFQPWGANEPNNLDGNEFCVTLSVQSGYRHWNDADCSLEFAFVCRYNM